MHIAFHLGAHCTDDERLLRTLLRNRGALANEGIVVPGPNRYRTLLRETVQMLSGRTATVETRNLLMEQITDVDQASRMVLCWDSFLNLPKWALSQRRLYPDAGTRARGLSEMFPEYQCEFFLAIRNPAGFLPALWEMNDRPDSGAFFEGIDLATLGWTEVIDDIRTHAPDVPLTVWCDEDSPLLWPEILRLVSGAAGSTTLPGGADLLASLLTPEGATRMEEFLTRRPAATATKWRRVAQSFLDTHLAPDANLVAINLPGWSEATLERLTARYDAEVAQLAARDDIRFLLP